MSDDYNIINLDELVDRSHYILMVEEASPFRIPMELRREGCSPYQTFKLHYTVIETLFAALPPREGERIEVMPADLAFQWQLHCEAEYGLNQMPVFDVYQSYNMSADESRYIIFLIASGSNYEFAVKGGYEYPALRQQVIDSVAGRSERHAAKYNLDMTSFD